VSRDGTSFSKWRGSCSSQPQCSNHPRREVHEQLGWRDTEPAGEAEDNGQAGYFGAALDLADVGGGQAGGVGEVLLGPAAVEAEAAEGGAEDFCFPAGWHPCKVTIVALDCRVTVVTMAQRRDRSHRGGSGPSNVLGFRRERDLTARRKIPVELPEFLIVLLEHREQEANEGASVEERVTMSHFVEYQVADLLSVRDVAELDMVMPGFAQAVQDWLAAARE
jgi:hypothetical protein